jgi:hypothetical protein
MYHQVSSLVYFSVIGNFVGLSSVLNSYPHGINFNFIFINCEEVKTIILIATNCEFANKFNKVLALLSTRIPPLEYLGFYLKHTLFFSTPRTSDGISSWDRYKNKAEDTTHMKYSRENREFPDGFSGDPEGRATIRRVAGWELSVQDGFPEDSSRPQILIREGCHNPRDNHSSILKGILEMSYAPNSWELFVLTSDYYGLS